MAATRNATPAAASTSRCRMQSGQGLQVPVELQIQAEREHAGANEKAEEISPAAEARNDMLNCFLLGDYRGFGALHRRPSAFMRSTV